MPKTKSITAVWLCVAAFMSVPVTTQAQENFPDRLAATGGVVVPVISDTAKGAARGTAIQFEPAGESKGTVLLLPGFGLSSLIYTETPDSRQGWAQMLAAAGYTVHAYNSPRLQVHGGEIEEGRVWQEERFWRRWGIGNTHPIPYEDTYFPVQHMQSFIDSLPVVSVSRGRGDDAAGTNQRGQQSQGQRRQGGSRNQGGRARPADPVEVANLLELMKHACPCTVMAHSASGSTVAALLKLNPGHFSALVLLEPLGIPADPSEVGLEPGRLDVLAVYGDRIEERNQTRRYEAVFSFTQELGDSGSFLFLPDEGIYGNTHLYMIDTNSEEVLSYVLDWMQNR